MTTCKILLIDTETNGLPANMLAPISMSEAWPAILQLSWQIYEVTGRTMTPGPKRDIGIALHPSLAWNADAAKIHSLTETEARHGTPAAEAYLEIAKVLRTVDVVVAHNLSFDKSVLRAAAYAEASRCSPAEKEKAAALRTLWPPGLGELCTCMGTRDLVRLPPSREGGAYKRPKLNELYIWLYGHRYDMSGATLHNAKSDVHCLASCLSGLLRRGLLTVSDKNRLVITSTENGV